MNDNDESVKILPSNKMEISRKSDGTVLCYSEGSIEVELKSIKSIGIENIIDIEKHEIINLFDSVSHYMRFHGGGEVQLSYNLDGRLLDLEITNVLIVVNEGNKITLKRALDKGSSILHELQ
ncbi:hypothetical protein [Iodobacter fluviatilis]|uniref:Uncharacterized protein n=1 Tax=Iodobacter fluviatilis TaxID=537 RepID=A0A7G3G8E9_9NEIS|nr:hypothetical protein [Iodobacter fluviatilis]QBC43597.1 hypothetical protein C1H71_08610 [Iodobacter fluviatilis]